MSIVKYRPEDLPDSIKVRVKYDDILIGLKQNQEYCPGALAIRREMAYLNIPFGRILVDEERIAIYHRDGELMTTMQTPPELATLIMNKDIDMPFYPIKPCEFNLYFREVNPFLHLISG